MKTKNGFRLIKYMLIVLFFTILSLVSLTKKVEANGIGYLREVGIPVSSSQITKINLNFKNPTHSSNLNSFFNSSGVGDGTERALSLNTEYWLYATNAFTYNGEQLNLKITFKPTYINDRVTLIMVGGNTSNVQVKLYSYDAQVQVKYEITKSNGELYNKNFCYGFTDPDGGDYLYSNAGNTQIYYRASSITDGSTPFGDAFRIENNGIIIQGDDIGFENSGLILVANHSNSSSFTINWSTKRDTNRPHLMDLLILPELYDEPTTLNIKINMNGGALQGEHSPNIGSNGNYVTRFSGDIAQSVLVTDLDQGIDIVNYNNPEFINVRRLGYKVNEGEEYIDSIGFTYSQTGSDYSLQEFGALNATGIVEKELFIKWVIQNYAISYTLNGGTAANNNPTTYTVETDDLNIASPLKRGYVFAGWKKTISNMDWDERFLNFNTGEPGLNETYPKAYSSGFISLKAGVTYTISGYGTYNANGIRWRIYNTSGTYLGGTTGGNAEGDTYTPTSDCLAKIMFINETTDTQRNSIVVSGNKGELGEIIPKGSTGNVSLSAQWEGVTYTIEYYQGNNLTTAGSTLLGSSSHTYGTAKNLSLYSTFSSSLPSSKPNTTWTFAGWSTSQTGTTVTYTDGQSVSDLTIMDGYTIKIYAIFKRDIRFYSGVNKTTTSTAQQRYNPYRTTGYITSVTAPTLTAITDWTAIGYRTDTTGGTATVTASTTATGTVTPVYDSTAIVYYGVYRKEYIVNFYSNINATTWDDITGFAYYNTNTASVPTTISVTLRTAAFSADIANWTEVGWRDDTIADNKEYDYGQANVTVPIGTSEFYSVYSRTLTITYDGNGNTGGSTADSTKTIYMNAFSTTTSSQSVGLRQNGFTKTGYKSSTPVWNTNANGTGTGIAANSTYNPQLAYNATPFGKTLYAQWTAISYTVEYYQGNNLTTAGSTLLGFSNHVYGTAKNLTSYSSFSNTLPSSKPNSTWEFAGWTTTQTGLNPAYSDGQSVSNLTTTDGAVIKLYAVFKRDVRFFSGINKASLSIQEQRYNPYRTTGYLTSNTAPPLLTINGWTTLGYRSDNVADAPTLSIGQSYTLFYDTMNTDFYGIYKNTYDVTWYSGVYKSNNITTSGEVFYNSANATLPNSVKITTLTREESTDIEGWSETGWRRDTTDDVPQCGYGQPNVTVPFGTSTFYGVYSKDYTANFYSGINKETNNPIMGLDWYNTNTQALPTTTTITLQTIENVADISEWTKDGWRNDTENDIWLYGYGQTGVSITIGTNNFYSVYYKNYTANFYSGISKATNTPISGKVHYNTNTQELPTTTTITMKTAADSANITNWTERGWRDDTTRGDREYTYGQADVSITIGTTNFYSVYRRVLRVKYDGNGADGGSTDDTTKNIYLNANNTTTSTQSITTRENGYTYTGYTAQSPVWNTKADGSGTSIAAGATYTLNPVIPYNASPFETILYAQWTANTATITIRKDNSNWTTDNNIQVALYQGGNSKYEYSVGAKTGATITWNAVTSGTYDIYASKDANNLTTLVDTGIDVTVSSTGTATIDYYSLQLQKGVGISAVSGAGTYLKNQTANIDATVSTGYTWQGWSVVSGDSPN